MTSPDCAQLTILRGPHAGVDVRYCFSVKQEGNAQRTNLSFIIGRHKSKSWLCLNDDLEVSTVHAEFRYESNLNSNSCIDREESWVLLDSKSTNGTRLNGHRIASGSSHRLHSQDLILVGKSLLRFIISNDCCLNANVAAKNSSFIVENSPIVKPEASDLYIEKIASEGENHDALKVIEPNIPDPSCAVCGINLSAMDFYSQNLHVNNCLDRRKSMAMTKVSSMKRKQLKSVQEKKVDAVLRDQTEEEEVAVALAISKSLTTLPAELDMNVSLLNGELRKIESDIVALLKKRTVIVKKLEKYRRQEIKSVNSNCKLAELGVSVNNYNNNVEDDLFPPLLCARRQQWNLMRVSNESEKQPVFSWWFRSTQIASDGMLGHTDDKKDRITCENESRNDESRPLNDPARSGVSIYNIDMSNKRDAGVTEPEMGSDHQPVKKSKLSSDGDQTYHETPEEV
uniref:AlNc14C15G1722 protein n=1 Tax=Albugo laibachii Nc14 TaxID=890382 RepID=F0W439_9STRA|nr:AlNc14C15G1722 [Albugo laibachii Nc14]|eukprot:CCA15836.1 AlNc14C15G1722 [Albugo laibachii Nc14]